MEPSVPRRCGRQIPQSNVPVDTPSEYYRRTRSIPVLDHLLSELGARFGSHQRTTLQGLSIVPSVAVSLESDDWTSRLKALCDLYENDLPSPQSFEIEVNCWLIKWKHELENHGENSLPKSLILTLRHISSMYPNIAALVKILCTLPVTTCSAERSFSSLKRIKTQSRMTNSRLSGLTLLHIHRDISIDLEKANDTFARMHPRWMRMAQILDNEGSQAQE